MAPSSSSIPVETILKIALDKSSAEDIQDWLDNHNRQWSTVEKTIGKIGDHLDSMGDSLSGLTRYASGLVGVAGVGAVVSNFFQTSQLGSSVALASGLATGGASTWHPYGQAMLQAQGQTGVKASEIGAGLVQALQGAGGTPTASQAAMIGGLLAGYGQVTGMTPSQVAQVVTPLLQAANKQVSYGSVMSLGGIVTGGLTNMPGSQSAGMQQLISQLGLQEAVGAGSSQSSKGMVQNLQGIVAAINQAVGSNTIWKNTSLTGSATQSIAGGLQNAYTNPSLEAFMQMGGISYNEQRSGFTASNVQKIMGEATKLYGTGTTRDLFLRSNFGLTGANLLETFTPGSKAADALEQALKNPSSSQDQQRFKDYMQNAQARTTPGTEMTSIEGKILHEIEKNFGTGALGVLGVLGGGKVLSGGLRGGARGLAKMLGGKTSGMTDAESKQLDDLLGKAYSGEPMTSTEDDLLDQLGTKAGLAGDIGTDSLSALGGLATGGALTLGTTLAGMLADPASAGIDPKNLGSKSALSAVQAAVKAGQKKFGSSFGNKRSQQWLWNQFGHRNSGQGSNVPGTMFWSMATGEGENTAGATDAQKILSNLFSQLAKGNLTSGGTDPITTFDQAVNKLMQAATKLENGTAKGTAYSGGASAQYAGFGTQAAQSLGSTPFAEFTALAMSSGSPLSAASGLSGSQYASYNTVGSTSGAGWQTCTLTWYDPALGGTNSASGAKDPTASTASGQAYSSSAYTCAAPSQYPFGTEIQFSYAGKTVTCTVNDRGGAITGSHFDLARAPATALGMIAGGVVKAKFKVTKMGSAASSSRATGSSGSTGGSSGSSSSGGAVAVAARTSTVGGAGSSGSGGSSSSQAIHVHVHIDSREIKRARVLKGKR
jgi:3D (Asp-Asp-Asp) domain-containing protein